MTLASFWYLDERLILLGFVAASMVLRSVTRWGSWSVRARPGRTGRLAYRIRQLGQYPILREAVRWLFYVGIPYAALLGGFVSLRTLGLTLPPEETWPVLAFFGLFFLVVLAAGWWHYTRVRPAHAVSFVPTSWRDDFFGWAQLWPDIVMHQSHWAFYRALPVAYVAGFAGPFLGVLLVLIEWGMDLLWWRALTRPRSAPAIACRLAMVVISAFGFAVSGSSLPGLTLHLIAEPVLFAIAGSRVRAPTMAHADTGAQVTDRPTL